MPLEAHGITDVGRKRHHNEDSFLVDENLGLFVVCDGMGGHAAGEVAASRCVEVIKQEIASHAEVVEQLRINPASTTAAVSLLENAVELASGDLFRTAQAEESKRGMGTTVVALLVGGNKAVLAHVGDSRVYLVRAGQVHRLTEDHTFVQAQIKAGILSKDQAESSPYKNVITRAVGIQPSVQVDTLLLDTLPGDRYLLCTDGLHGYLRDDELPQFMSEGKGLPERLVALANERGGKDNITAVVVELTAGRTATPVDLEMTLDVEARLRAVRNMPLFRHLTYKEQMAVLAVGQVQSYPPGDEIVRQNADGDELFVVVGGRVAVESGGIKIAELGLGGHFGEMGIVDNAPRSATVRPLELTRCLIFKRVDLMGLMRREPVLAVKLLWAFVQALSDRLRTANAELTEARTELEQRVEAQTPNPFGEI